MKKASVAPPAQSKENKKLMLIESFWGAIASFFLVQIFGYFVYQGFIFNISSILGIIMGGLVWVAVFLYFQSWVIQSVWTFVFSYHPQPMYNPFRSAKETVKFFLTFVFIFILIQFMLGYYPYPKKESSPVFTAAFFIFSWAISSVLSKMKPVSGYRQITPMDKRHIGTILIGLLFFGLGFIPAQMAGITISYFHGMAGLGLLVMLMTAWLIRR